MRELLAVLMQPARTPWDSAGAYPPAGEVAPFDVAQGAVSEVERRTRPGLSLRAPLGRPHKSPVTPARPTSVSLWAGAYPPAGEVAP